jgi:phage baseplate assembly protein W
MRPNFGTLIPYSIFNSEDNAVGEITNEVRRAFSEQLSLLSLQTVSVNSDSYTNTLSVEVVYGLPNNEIVSTLVGLVLVPGAKPIYEELL